MARSAAGSELQREMKQAGSAAEYLAEIEARFDHPDLVADPASHQRDLRVIEHNALFAVEPALTFVDSGNDGGGAERQTPARNPDRSI
jgi:hypothetical protein